MRPAPFAHSTSLIAASTSLRKLERNRLYAGALHCRNRPAIDCGLEDPQIDTQNLWSPGTRGTPDPRRKERRGRVWKQHLCGDPLCVDASEALLAIQIQFQLNDAVPNRIASGSSRRYRSTNRGRYSPSGQTRRGISDPDRACTPTVLPHSARLLKSRRMLPTFPESSSLVLVCASVISPCLSFQRQTILQSRRIILISINSDNERFLIPRDITAPSQTRETYRMINSRL